MGQEASIYPLKAFKQHYDWGTQNDIYELFNWQKKDNRPLAELWMGAHPKGPTLLQNELGEWIELASWISEQSPEGLGNAVNSEQELLFLFKVLSAAKALSIQVHPNKNQAEAGFEQEETEGIKDRNASDRNYKDANHKPELICALTPFVAMSGFREFSEINALVSPLEIDWLDRYLLNARENVIDKNKIIKNGFIQLLSLETSEQTKCFNDLVDACIRQIGMSPTSKDFDLYKKQSVLSPYLEVLLMAEQYPNDIGIISPLLMQLFWLDIGEALYLKAGIPHAYLRGTGLEIMAASDNVLRGGLTPKHIDLIELNKIMTHGPHKIQLIKPKVINTNRLIYEVDVPDFKLIISDLQGVTEAENYLSNGLEIVLCIQGEVQINANDTKLALNAGDCCLLTKGEVHFAGNGRVAIACNNVIN